MRALSEALGFVSLLLAGAIFGFFYAWVCSTMWGLDVADPRVAIAAMQAMNDSVRNAVFAPAFFGTPFVMLAAGSACWAAGGPRAAMFFALGGVIYLVGGLILTISVNVPMNRALGEVVVPDDVDAAHAIWEAYSPRWQVFNIVRTLMSGAALIFAGLGVRALGRERGPITV